MVIDVTNDVREPENLNEESRVAWRQLKKEIDEIKAREGIVDIPPEISPPEDV
jgi:hypothetical protein